MTRTGFEESVRKTVIVADCVIQEELGANHTLSEGHMRVVLEAADAIQLGTELCERFRGLLALGKAAFIKEQMRQVFYRTDLIWHNFIVFE